MDTSVDRAVVARHTRLCVCIDAWTERQPTLPFKRRQASEQYFTSSQVRAQRRRHVMARPQASQGLLGSAALLPRNAEEDGFFAMERPRVQPSGAWQTASTL